MRALMAAVTTAIVGNLAPEALASTMPAADFRPAARTLGLGVGFGGGLSVDAAVAQGLSAGFSGSWLAVQPEGERFDLHLLYQFVDGGDFGLSIAGIVGLWADTSLPGGPFPFPPLEAGFGLAYPFTEHLVGRLNLVVQLFNSPTRPYDVFGGPAAGLELGYRFRPDLEATLGLNGQGNLLGSRLRF